MRFPYVVNSLFNVLTIMIYSLTIINWFFAFVFCCFWRISIVKFLRIRPAICSWYYFSENFLPSMSKRFSFNVITSYFLTSFRTITVNIVNSFFNLSLFGFWFIPIVIDRLFNILAIMINCLSIVNRLFTLVAVCMR